MPGTIHVEQCVANKAVGSQRSTSVDCFLTRGSGFQLTVAKSHSVMDRLIDQIYNYSVCVLTFGG